MNRVLMSLSSWFRSLLGTPRPTPVPTPVPIPEYGDQDTDPSGTLVNLVNSTRKGYGLPPYVRSYKLDNIAQAWAEEMSRTGVLSHGDFVGRIGAAFPGAAENILNGPRSSSQAFGMWMASPQHRANILGTYDAIGVGYAGNRDGSFYWCADFANTKGVE